MGAFAVATALLMATWRFCVQQKRLQWWDNTVLRQSAPITTLWGVEGGNESYLLQNSSHTLLLMGDLCLKVLIAWKSSQCAQETNQWDKNMHTEKSLSRSSRPCSNVPSCNA